VWRWGGKGCDDAEVRGSWEIAHPVLAILQRLAMSAVSDRLLVLLFCRIPRLQETSSSDYVPAKPSAVEYLELGELACKRFIDRGFRNASVTSGRQSSSFTQPTTTTTQESLVSAQMPKQLINMEIRARLL
jgi:hypothetical protein